MSANSKALFLIIALAALILGAWANRARIETVNADIATPLLNAQLKLANSQLQGVQPDLSALNLVNFWASWCAPCRHEMPIFENMSRRYSAQGFQVIGIAIDSPERTRDMLDSMDIRYPIYYAENSGMLLMEQLGNPQGLLPYSLLIDKNGAIIEQVLGQINEQQIQQWVTKHLPSAS